MDNFTYKETTWGYIPCIVVYHNDSILDYILDYSDTQRTKYRVNNLIFKNLETAKEYVINKFYNIPD